VEPEKGELIMLETLFVKTRAVVVQQGKKNLRWARIFPPSIWIILAVLVFVGGRWSWLRASRPAHRQEITAAFGSASLFHGAPQISHSGDQFTLVKTSAHGYALYLCNADNGQKQILFEQNNYLGQHENDFDLQALPWSPDDTSFLCVVSNWLVIYPLDTGQPEFAIKSKAVGDAVWLNPAEFAYLVNETNLCIAQKQDDGKWQQHEFLSRSNRMASLTAISEDTVAWLEGNAICRVNLTEGLPGTNSIAAPVSATNMIAPPADGLALWLDASTLRQPDRSLVMHLTDLSRNKNDALPNGRPPTFNSTNSPAALNGKSTIRFALLNSSVMGTGLKTRLRPGIIGSAPRSFFVVMRHEADRPMMVNMGDTANKGSLFSIEWSDRLYLPALWKADTRIRMASTNWNILEVVYDGTEEKGYVNGIVRGIANAKLNTADKEIEIGLRTATGGKNAKAAQGDFAELLVYDRALNFNERKQVEDYLGRKWFGIKNKNPTAQNPYVWFVPPAEGLTSFSYSKESGQFLLNCTEARRGFLWQYDPQTANLTKVAEGDIEDEQWFGDGQSGYLLHDSRHGGIVLRDAFGAEEDRALQGANVLWFGASDADTMLLLGSISNQPSAAIWQYDVASSKLKPLIPYSDEPSIYAKGVSPTNITIKTPSGENLACTIYLPLNFNPRKKYPLVIGNTVFTDPIYRYQGPGWAPAVANCGGYVVIVERRSWFKGLDDWGTNIMSAYNSLKKDLRIDTSQVYLFGSSAETAYMDQVLTNSSGLWKGLILLNPSQLPDLSKVPGLRQRPKILISAGSEEHEEDRFKKYQADALNYGGIVEYIIHPGENHHLVGNDAQRERSRAIMHFIFEE
jgi:hypothetical protein